MVKIVDTLLHNSEQLLITTNSESSNHSLQPIQNGILAIDDGEIVYAGTEENLDTDLKAKRKIDASGKVITPGFTDPHTHTVYAGERSGEFEQKIQGVPYMKIADEGGGILSTVRSTRNASEQALFDLAFRRLNAMKRHGTTTCEIKTGYGLSTEHELKMLRVIDKLNQNHPITIVPTFLGAHTFPEQYQSRKSEYVSKICDEMIPEVARQGIAEFCDVFCEQNVFTAEQTREILSVARSHELDVKVHAEQFERIGGSKIAAEMNAYSADHLEVSTKEDLKRLAAHNVIPVLLPGTAYFSQLSGRPPIDCLRESGAPIALGTDHNPGTCPALSMPLMTTLGCLEMNLTPKETLLAGTIYASRSVNCENDKGSLEPGKDADFICWNISDYREIPYWFGQGSTLIDQVFIDGQKCHDAS